MWRGTTISAGWLLLLFVGAYLITPASILPLVMTDLGITEATAAALVSMPQVAATVIGIPVGIYLDHVETRTVIPAAATVLLIGSIGDWFAASGGTVSLLIASRLLAGVGMFVLWVTCINVAASTFPPTRRATATSVIISGYPAGYALGQLGAPRVAAAVGWPGVFPVFGFAVLVMSFAFYIAVGRVPRFHTSTEPMTLLGFKRVIRKFCCTECAGLLRFADSDGRRFTEYGSLGFFSLPPAGVQGRSPQEMLEAAWTWRHADFLTDSAGVCSRCSAKLETSVEVCESHDDSDGMCEECERRYAMMFNLYCPNCNYDPTSIAPGVLLSNTELLAFLTARGINPFTPESLNRASQALAEYDEEIISTDPFEARLTFTVDGDSITLTFDDHLSVVDVTRSETNEDG